MPVFSYMELPTGEISPRHSLILCSLRVDMRFPDNCHEGRPKFRTFRSLDWQIFAQIPQNRGPSQLVSDTLGPVENGPIGPSRT